MGDSSRLFSTYSYVLKPNNDSMTDNRNKSDHDSVRPLGTSSSVISVVKCSLPYPSSLNHSPTTKKECAGGIKNVGGRHLTKLLESHRATIQSFGPLLRLCLFQLLQDLGQHRLNVFFPLP